MTRQSNRILTLLLICALLCSALCFFASAAPDQDDAYTQSLIDKGFPTSYAERLTELHMLHPTWEFEPLPVTKLNAAYTWEYVIGKETENPKTNLIHKSESYAPYRHATNTELYDSGWYAASEQAVAYFMDPENFLNEKDIFMFQDLKYSEHVSVATVESALRGTFMAETVLYDDVTYAAYLVEVGKALNVDPLHLAARLRQEQGAAGNSPLVKGNCGDKLWYYYENQIQTENGKQVLAPDSGHTQEELLAYNGLYNYFNVGAAGTGTFAIYLGAMKAAQKGTEEMAEQWGGSAAWDTPAKAIYGGAFKLTSKYVGDYQNTLYLQKFNVDPRSSRNFWGQYMQNVGAALSEARTMFNSLYAMECIDLPYHFLIPVYEGKTESPDPAQGACSTYAAADSMVDYEFSLTAPQTSEAVVNSTLYLADLQMYKGERVQIAANAFASLAFESFWISVDGQSAQQLACEYDSTAAPAQIGNNATGESPNALTYDCTTLPEGDHTLAIYGRLANPGKACPHYLLAVIEISVKLEPETTEPETTEPETTEPETTEPETTEPETTESETTEPETTEPETTEPETTESKTTEPETTEPETQAQTNNQASTKGETKSLESEADAEIPPQERGCKSIVGAAFVAVLMLGALALKKK
ncbi:MAG: hypothetical protein E7581_02945 [Ruminococcaceae bacterium]|nr:hypothetical protein [Oscillospiraceae bacterium]